MKVLIFWNGFQGQKHAAYWWKRGAQVTIVTKTGSEGTRMFSEIKNVKLWDFSIVVVSVRPTEEQERVIQYLFDTHYDGYCIIEKPVAFSEALLEKLVFRKKTVFFVDEAFYPLSSKAGRYEVEIFTEHAADYINMYEHAVGFYLFNAEVQSIVDNLHVSLTIGGFSGYAWSGVHEVASKNGVLIMNGSQVAFSFDAVYGKMLLLLQNEEALQLHKENFVLFRKFFIRQT